MTIQQIRYIIEIARSGSMNEASKKLFLSQPALSSTLKDVEEELGIEIFIRTGKGMILSAEGMEFLSYASQIDEQFDLLEKRYLVESRQIKRFSLSTQHYAFTVLAFASFVNENKGTEYEYIIRETKTHEIICDVADLKSELGIIYINDFNTRILQKVLDDKKLKFEKLFIAKPHIFISSGNPLAGRRKVGLEELEDYPYLSFEQGSSNPFFFSEEILSTIPRAKSIKVSDRATLFNLLIGINGYTISTGIICSELNGPDIVAIPLDITGNITVGFICKKDVILSNNALLYIDCLKKTIDNEQNKYNQNL